MPREEVIRALGPPGEVSAQGSIGYLKYGWDNPGDDKIAAADWYFVRLVGGRTESYGRVGDFDSTKDPTLGIKLDPSRP